MEKTSKELATEVIEAAFEVIQNADDSGCSDDLTVTSKKAVEKLHNALLQLKAMGEIKEIKETTNE